MSILSYEHIMWIYEVQKKSSEYKNFYAHYPITNKGLEPDKVIFYFNDFQIWYHVYDMLSSKNNSIFQIRKFKEDEIFRLWITFEEKPLKIEIQFIPENKNSITLKVGITDRIKEFLNAFRLINSSIFEFYKSAL